jgi:cobalt/nickel transport system ATP-binding protein
MTDPAAPTIAGSTPGPAATPAAAEPALDPAADPAVLASEPAIPAVSVQGLQFAYPDGRVALAGVDLSVARGERVAILGPNGAGKSTLVLHLNGIHRPQQGAVAIGGTAVAPANLPDIRRRVGIVFQDPDDQLFMSTVRDDVAFGPAHAGLKGADLDARVDAALEAVGMAAQRGSTPHHLSFGQRRRVAIATVLATRPDVLVLDEPTANLDPAARRELTDVLAGLDITLLVVTHDLPYALELCPRAVILDEGRITADGPTAEILGDTDLLAAHRLYLPKGFDPAQA